MKTDISIPKIIIQTWKTKQLSYPFTAFVKRMRALNPDFDYKLFSDADADEFVRMHYPAFVEAWSALKTPVEKADLFRVLAVHHFGGFYFDLDVIMCRPLTPLLEYGCVFPFEQMADPYTASSFGIHEQLGQYAFGARPGHPLLLRYAENIRDVALNPALGPPKELLDRHPSPNEVLRIVSSTGPGMLARTLGREPELGADVRVLAATQPGSRKRRLYCFGYFGSHAMLGMFGWKTRGAKAGIRAPLQFVVWLRLIAHAYEKLKQVKASESLIEAWRKPAPWKPGPQ